MKHFTTKRWLRRASLADVAAALTPRKRLSEDKFLTVLDRADSSELVNSLCNVASVPASAVLHYLERAERPPVQFLSSARLDERTLERTLLGADEEELGALLHNTHLDEEQLTRVVEVACTQGDYIFQGAGFHLVMHPSLSPRSVEALIEHSTNWAVTALQWRMSYVSSSSSNWAEPLSFLWEGDSTPYELKRTLTQAGLEPTAGMAAWFLHDKHEDFLLELAAKHEVDPDVVLVLAPGWTGTNADLFEACVDLGPQAR